MNVSASFTYCIKILAIPNGICEGKCPLTVISGTLLHLLKKRRPPTYT